MQNLFRHGIIQHQQSVGVQTFLSVTGNLINLHVANRHLVYTIAHKDSDYLFTELSDTLGAWEVDTSTQTWLGFEIDQIHGEREFITTEIPPSYGATAPTSPSYGSYWFDTTQTTMKKWNGSRFIPCFTLFIASTINGQLTSTVNLSTYIGSTANLNVPSNPGSVLFDEADKIIYKSDGTALTTEDRMSSSIHKSSHVKIGSIGFLAVAGENIPRHHLVVLNQDGRVYLSEGTDLGTHLHGIVEYDQNTGDVVRVCTEGFFEDPAWNWSAPGKPVYANGTGRLTETPNSRFVHVGYTVSPKSVHLTNVGQYHVHPVLGTGEKGQKGEIGPMGPAGGIGSGEGTGSGFILREPNNITTKHQLGVNLNEYSTETVVSGNYRYADGEFDLVLRPSFMGAITAEYSGTQDGVVGAKPRGNRALDLQRRPIDDSDGAAALEYVAKGEYSTILNGSGNQTIGVNTTILNGIDNTVGGLHSVIISGARNTTSGHNDVIVSGTDNTTTTTNPGPRYNTIISSTGINMTDVERCTTIGGSDITFAPYSTGILSVSDTNVAHTNIIHDMLSFGNSGNSGMSNSTLLNNSGGLASGNNSLISNNVSLNGSVTYSTILSSDNTNNLNGNKIFSFGSTGNTLTSSVSTSPITNVTLIGSSGNTVTTTGNGPAGSQNIALIGGSGGNIIDSVGLYGLGGSIDATNSVGVRAIGSNVTVVSSTNVTALGSSGNVTNSYDITMNGVASKIDNVHGVSTRGKWAVGHVNGSHVTATTGYMSSFIDQTKHYGQSQKYEVLLTTDPTRNLSATVDPSRVILFTDADVTENQITAQHEINVAPSRTVLIVGDIIGSGLGGSEWKVRVLCNRVGTNTVTIKHAVITSISSDVSAIEVSVVGTNIIRFSALHATTGRFLLANLEVIEMMNSLF